MCWGALHLSLSEKITILRFHGGISSTEGPSSLMFTGCVKLTHKPVSTSDTLSIRYTNLSLLSCNPSFLIYPQGLTLGSQVILKIMQALDIQAHNKILVFLKYPVS